MERGRGKKSGKQVVTGGLGWGRWGDWWWWEGRGGGVCLQPSTGGWRTHTPNHANAERAKWKRVGGNETEDETTC